MRLSREHLYYQEFWVWFVQHFKVKTYGLTYLRKNYFSDIPHGTLTTLYYEAMRGRRLSRTRPRGWSWEWPAPPYPGYPDLEHPIPTSMASVLGTVTPTPTVKSPAETFAPPDGYKTGNVISDATGERLGDEEASRVLEPVFETKEVPRNVDGLLDGFERAQREKKLHDQSQRKARIDFTRLKVPICIMQHTDVHWGSEDTDYAAIRRHLTLLKQTPYLYAFGTGDFEEFAKLKHRGAVEGQIHSPTVQARAVRAGFVETWEKWLAVVLGNHDMRIFLESGFDVGEYLLGEVPKGKKRIPFLRDGGLVVVELGEQVYTHNIFHGDSAFGTRFNETHKARQTARMVDGRCDVTWNGHTHNPAIQDTNEPSDDMGGARDACYMQGGSYKVLGDDHAVRRKFLMVDDVQMPAVIQFPDRHLTLPFKRVETAVMVHALLVEAYKRGQTIGDVLPEVA